MSTLFFFLSFFFFLDVGVETTLLELRSCVKVEVAVLGSPSLIVRTVSVDVKQCRTRTTLSVFGQKRREQRLFAL